MPPPAYSPIMPGIFIIRELKGGKVPATNVLAMLAGSTVVTPWKRKLKGCVCLPKKVNSRAMIKTPPMCQ